MLTHDLSMILERESDVGDPPRDLLRHIAKRPATDGCLDIEAARYALPANHACGGVGLDRGHVGQPDQVAGCGFDQKVAHVFRITPDFRNPPYHHIDDLLVME